VRDKRADRTSEPIALTELGGIASEKAIRI